MALDTSNRNTLWASLLVAEWERAGLRAVVLAPGSRSTPLAVAFARSSIPRYVVPDERGAAFLALGLARAYAAPVAIVTTSGTATANLHPAVMEAHHGQVPLLVLTADRPAELQHSGANQTTEQSHLYGPSVRWFHQVALPEAAPPPRLLRYLRVVADRSLAYARGWGMPPGPVHLNLPFRKPLAPQPRPQDRLAEALAQAPAARSLAEGPYARLIAPPATALAPQAVAEVAAYVQKEQPGLIIAGPGACESPACAATLLTLARRLRAPLLADPLAGVRFGPWVPDAPILAGVSRALNAGWRPSAAPAWLLQIGAAPVGFGPLRYLAELPGTTRAIRVTRGGQWNDPEFRPGWHIWAEPAVWLAALAEALPSTRPNVPSLWQSAWLQAERDAWATDEPPSPCREEGQVAWHLTRHAPSGACLFVSNSLPIRHVDEWGRPHPRPLRVCANRGLSGIDGVLATATGVALGRPHRPTVLLIGDLALYHDLNSLALAPRLGARLGVALLNNRGGRIFQRLPIAAYDPPFTEMFRVPWEVNFAAQAQSWGWAYARYALHDPALPDALRRLWHVSRPTLLEIGIAW